MTKTVSTEDSIYSTNANDDNINRNQILKEFYQNADKYQYTHYINNRWENIYLNAIDIPSVKPLLNFAIGQALIYYAYALKPHETIIIPHDLLGYEKNEFWFNAAKPVESTDVHNHNQKAFLSGVYYLQVPKHSGNIHFKGRNGKEFSIEGEEGKLILFPSELDHYVPENCSREVRISISFNFYKLPLMSVEIK